MLRKTLHSVVRWIQRVITQPQKELNRWQRAVRFAYDLGRYGWRQLKNDRASQMAAALSFRSLFALVPVMIVATVLVKAYRGTEDFLQLTRDLLVSFKLDLIVIVPPDIVPTEGTPQTTTLAEWLTGLVAQAASVDLSAVGWVGVAVIAYAAVSLMVTIENGFNIIYRAPQGRPWTRRLPIYWSVLTLSPVLMGITWFLNSFVEEGVQAASVAPWLIAAINIAWGITMTWLVLFVSYRLLPNTVVKVRPAMIGALVAAILFEIGKHFLDVYLTNVFAINQLYGSLGLIPLFMFWGYLMWLCLLFGLEVSATLQMLAGRDIQDVPARGPTDGIVDPAAVVSTMEVIAERFAAGQSTLSHELAETVGVAEPTVTRILDQLVDKGILYRIDGAQGTLALARPPESITAEQLIEIGFQLVDQGGGHRRSTIIESLRQAQLRLAANTTLANLLLRGDSSAQPQS